LKPGTNEQVIKDVAEEIHKNKLSSFLSAKPLSELYPNLFDWLELQKMNEFIIVLLMTIVAMVNLITMLLILILERSKFIGILKTIGARTIVITKIFVYQSAYIVAVGILIGNILGIGICLLQKYFHIITLDEETYFVSYAPIYFDWLYIIFISILVFAIAMLTLLLPTFLISSIKPSKVLRFS
jgi:lipoprotein-releasing system permease protein